MSSVRKKDRSENRFAVLDKCLGLYEHTANVTANPIFDKYPAIRNRIAYEASMIYHCCRVANEEFDARKQDEAAMRIKLQKQAVEHCMWLKSYIMLAKKMFHLRARKITYWNGLAKDAMRLIGKWNKSETEKYKDTWAVGC